MVMRTIDHDDRSSIRRVIRGIDCDSRSAATMDQRDTFAFTIVTKMCMSYKVRGKHVHKGVNFESRRTALFLSFSTNTWRENDSTLLVDRSRVMDSVLELPVVLEDVA